MSRAARVALGAVALAWALVAERAARAPAEQAIAQTAPEQLVLVVEATHPHDPTAYTQGLLLHEGALYESTGKYGDSSLRRVDPATGTIAQQVDLPDTVFAEGLARVGDRLIQLSWREEIAFTWDLATFEAGEELGYQGEGWGLCHDGQRLIMSNGSSTLTFRDPETFAPTGLRAVHLGGQPVPDLNELECVDGAVYANLWRQTRIVRIDPETGAVTAVIDASAVDADLRARYHLPDPYDCLNGIAHIPGTDRFYVTGKHWPELYEARFLPPADATATAAARASATATATASASATADPTREPTATATATSTGEPTATPGAAYLPVGWARRR